jgi:hypothetical protein
MPGKKPEIAVYYLAIDQKHTKKAAEPRRFRQELEGEKDYERSTKRLALTSLMKCSTPL